MKNILKERKESSKIEVKRSIELISVESEKIEECIVGIANSSPIESDGWIVFGIDDSFEVVGSVDLTGQRVLDESIVKARKQQFSQIAGRVKPPLHYDWFDVEVKGKKTFVIRISSRKPGHFFQTSKGAVLHRLGEYTQTADEHQIRIWLGEVEETVPPIPPFEEPKVTSLAIYLSVLIVGFSGFFFWIVSPSRFVPNSFISLVVVGVVLLLLQHLRSWKTSEIFRWCMSHSHRIIGGVFVTFLASLIFGLSLNLYPIVSRIRYSTHLSDIPLSSSILLLILLGTGVLHLPDVRRISLRITVQKTVGLMKQNRRQLLTLIVITSVATASIVPLDINLLICTHRVKFVEKEIILDGTVYVYQRTRYSFSGYVRNKERVHFIAPLIPLTTTGYYMLSSNSTQQPRITTQKGLQVTLAFEEVYLKGLEICFEKDASESLIEVEYYSEMNITTIATIQLSHERHVQTFQNGTLQWETEITIVNNSPYRLTIRDDILIAYNIVSFAVEEKSTNSGLYLWASKNLYLYGTLFEGGRYTARIRYNEG